MRIFVLLTAFVAGCGGGGLSVGVDAGPDLTRPTCCFSDPHTSEPLTLCCFTDGCCTAAASLNCGTRNQDGFAICK